MTAYLADSRRRITQALRELTDEAGYPPSIWEIAETGRVPSVSIRANAIEIMKLDLGREYWRRTRDRWRLDALLGPGTAVRQDLR
ncbi:hypothetical protein ACIGW8_26850 [Streptomyces sioyaensis]|uniref:hypothetical protein n=1 Tax=Streptomyces sioyaensis TaxID=67364 RepID=UPI0037CE0E8A